MYSFSNIMKLKLFSISLIFLSLFFSSNLFAQFEIGASYELRTEEPKSGFGLRIQKSFLNSVPLMNFSLRAHASYFSEENSADQSGVNFDNDFTSYDIGIAVVGGIYLGLLEPYVGFGMGTESLEFKEYVTPGDLGVMPYTNEENETNIYWNTFVGAKVTIIPLVKPFVEYRYSGSEISSPTFGDGQSERIMFGVVLSF